MAVERVVDLENQRFADREYAGSLPLSGAAEEQARAERQHAALARLRGKAAADPVVADVLTLLGLDE